MGERRRRFSSRPQKANQDSSDDMHYLLLDMCSCLNLPKNEAILVSLVLLYLPGCLYQRLIISIQ